MSIKKILITGASGQLGSAINMLCSQQRDRFEIINTAHTDLDITDFLKVQLYLGDHAPDYIVNCAAYTAVDKAESDQKRAFEINKDGARNVAKVSAALKIPIIHISTDFVFDGSSSTPLNEEDLCRPINVYGQSKYEGEKAVQAENTKHFIIRTSWLYSNFGSNFLKSISKLAKEKSSLNIVFDQIGTPTFANDLAEVIVKIIDSNASDYGIYHYSNEGVASWYDFAKELIELQGIQCDVRPILTSQYPTPAKRPSYSVLNKAKIKSTFGIDIPYWKESLRKCIEEQSFSASINQ